MNGSPENDDPTRYARRQKTLSAHARVVGLVPDIEYGDARAAYQKIREIRQRLDAIAQLTAPKHELDAPGNKDFRCLTKTYLPKKLKE